MLVRHVLSYPGSYAQLQQIYPDIQTSTDLTWATDDTTLDTKTTWATGTSQSQSTSFAQNYSFENDLSVQGADGVPGVSKFGISTEFDTSGSFGFSDMNKSTTTLGKSQGIGVHKPETVREPANYLYYVTPVIFGHMKPGGSVDDALLTGDVQTFGLLQTAFTVDPIGSAGSPAGVWWGQAYTAPDVALNHPNRWIVDLGPDSASRPGNCLPLGSGKPSQMNCAKLAPSSPADPWSSKFHDMRGFFISSANHPGQGPQIESAKAGDKLALQARVYNYSLKEMDPDSKVHVRFYGMPWNYSNHTPAGDSFLIGEDARRVRRRAPRRPRAPSRHQCRQRLLELEPDLAQSGVPGLEHRGIPAGDQPTDPDDPGPG